MVDVEVDVAGVAHSNCVKFYCFFFSPLLLLPELGRYVLHKVIRAWHLVLNYLMLLELTSALHLHSAPV